ncbi:MAG: hypothetical protein LBD41_07280 [Clostridiales Family XIII bacterium]|jgi:hypothetical protein|nr:hypothetical protein [Clostridiales Family XIII bacterium]
MVKVASKNKKLTEPFNSHRRSNKFKFSGYGKKNGAKKGLGYGLFYK